MMKEYLQQVRFDWPWMLVLLAAIPWLVVWLWRSEGKRTTAMWHPSTRHLESFTSWRISLRRLPMLVQALGLACLVVAMARPSKYENIPITEGSGIDIVLCLDISGSMLARDFQPDRLRASIEVAQEFVRRRTGDRIGLVAFSGQSLGLCPLTTDQNAVLYQLERLEYGQLSDGTSIGTGLASAVDRLRNAKSPSRVVILLTDGEDTGGFLDPATATTLALNYGIRVYTVGVGTIGYAPMPYKTATGTELRQEKVTIDEALLTRIATQTGGQYFRATNRQSLDSIYTSIDKLERSKVKTSIFVKRTEAYFPWVAAALALTVLQVILSTTIFRKLP